MYFLQKKVITRNLLLGAGALYLSMWLAIPLQLGFYRLTAGLIYRGQFNGAVVMPLVERFPDALVAAVAGAAVIFLVESERPLVWTVFPALLYMLSGFLGYHWARPPMLLDRIQQTVGAVFPAFACILGGFVAVRWRATSHSDDATPG